ncbi:MAG: DUF6242 domain-containing protein [Tannerella sp.]|jgi:hypothetical protein|nr:DUF6242 domain-containing protein [Tannerella sp.]
MENVKRIYLCLAGSLLLLLSSCLGSDDDESADWLYSNCQIKSFTLKNDSISGLSSVKFTIDQVNGLIYNKDSMAYGTVIDEKVVCTITYEVGALSVEVYQDATKDSAYWNGSDSLNFSSFVRFDVYSVDGKAVKRYIAKLNVHQQLPDSMEWTLRESPLLGKTVQDQKVIAHNGSYWMYVKGQDGYELYRSSNAIDWTKSNLTGLTEKTFILSQLVSYEGFLYLPTTEGVLYQSVNGTDWSALDGAPVVKAVLGVVYESGQLKRPSALATVINDNNKWYYAAMNKELQWQTGNEISTTFPVSGFGHVSHEVMYYQRLMVVAGKDRNNQLYNAAWETMDGLQWVQLTDDRANSFNKREGIALTTYDDDFYLFGGIDASNTAKKDIYRSKNKGVTWELVDSLITFPDAYKARGYSSVLVDDDNFILLFGGKENTSANMLDELWSGRINRLGFKD